jgi:hypothetical protein
MVPRSIRDEGWFMTQVFLPNETSELPFELAGSTPRRVCMTRTGWLNVLAAFLFLSLGAAWAISLAKSVREDATNQSALKQQGVQAEGWVTEKQTQGTSTYVRYTFVVDGTSHTGRSKVPVGISDELHVSDALPIRYLPSSPDRNHPAAWEDSPNSSLWLLSISAVLVLLATLLVRRFPLQRRLAREGIPTRGCIAKREWKGPSKGQRYIDYTFRNVSNNEVEIGSCPCDSDLKDGTNVWVLYISSNPRQSEIYPFEIDLFRIVP